MHHLPIHPTLLHPLTGQPLRAAGIVGGRVVWPIMGASEDSDDANDDNGDADDKGDADDAGGQSDAENKMLIDERNGRKAAETLLAEMTGKSKAEVRKLLRGGTDKAREALTPAPKGDADDKADQPDADQIRRDAEAKANARIVRAEVRALAAEFFANPLDALHNLNLDDYEVNEEGELEDAAAVKAALADVLKKNPHYAKKGKGPKPDPSQGPRGNGKPDPGPGVARIRAAYADTAK